MTFTPWTLSLTLAGVVLLSGCGPQATNAQAASPAPVTTSSAPVAKDLDQRIRKVLAERIPKLPPIDEVRHSPLAGLYEVRFGGSEIIYVDAEAKYLMQGSLIDTQTLVNLTDERIEQATAVAFNTLPLKDALVFKQGEGKRRMAVFVDPNCGYCKRFERDLTTIDNVTIYAFLLPILGPDSTAKSRDIWCTKDGAKAWRAWMLDGALPGSAAKGCDSSALDRNLAFAKQHRINGTPALMFEDNTRKGGALPAKTVQELLDKAAKKS